MLRNVALQTCVRLLHERLFAPSVPTMNSAHALSTPHDTPVIARRLTLVEAPPADRRRPPAGAGVGALAAGLATGFVMAAAAAVLGGGDPSMSLRLAAVCAVGSLVARVRQRRDDVRRARRRATTAARQYAPGPRAAQIRRAA